MESINNMKKVPKHKPMLFEFTNEFRTWYCLRYIDKDFTSEHDYRKKFVYNEKLGHCSNDAYRFRTEEDRLLFIIRFGVQ